jgi:MFS family permease
MSSPAFLILLAHGLTKFGDAFWDLALPLALVEVFPNDFKPLVSYLLFGRLFSIIFNLKLGYTIDRKDPFQVVLVAILLQILGVLLILSVILNHNSLSPLIINTLIGLSGGLIYFGSSFVFTALSAKWLPNLFSREELPKINSKLKQLILLSELSGPLVSGVLYPLLSYNFSATLSFTVIGAINILTFVLELLCLKVLCHSGALREIKLTSVTIPRLKRSLRETWRLSYNVPVFPLMIAQACLWHNVVTPHGAYITTYMKATNILSDFHLSLLRASGALAGILITIAIPTLLRRYSLVSNARAAVLTQLIGVSVASIIFFIDLTGGLLSFCIALVLSRFGLYASSIVELTARQELVPTHIQGEVGALANSINQSATCLLSLIAFFTLGVETFWILVIVSLIATYLGAFMTWRFSPN